LLTGERPFAIFGFPLYPLDDAAAVARPVSAARCSLLAVAAQFYQQQALSCPFIQ
jgi:hypothetical protein